MEPIEGAARGGPSEMSGPARPLGVARSVFAGVLGLVAALATSWVASTGWVVHLAVSALLGWLVSRATGASRSAWLAFAFTGLLAWREALFSDGGPFGPLVYLGAAGCFAVGLGLAPERTIGKPAAS